MSDDVIRVGIIGAGANTKSKHIPGLQAIDDVEVVCVCNRSRLSSEEAAKECRIPRVHEMWPDVIEDPEVDAVVIGTWPYLHCRATVAALEAGKHVLCEARMAMDAAEAHRMLAAAQARPRLVAQIVPSPMTLRVDRWIQRLIADGYVGQVLAIEVRAGGEFLDREAPLHWRQDWDLSGTNVLSLGIWYEAVMRWVGHATRVAAMGKTFVKMRQAEDGFAKAVRIPEHVDVTAQMECGAQAHFQCSAVTGLGGKPEALIFGEEGTLRFCEDVLYGGKRGDAELLPIEIPAPEQGGWRVEDQFINSIRGLEPVTRTTFEDGVKYMEFTEAVARSMATGRAVTLPLDLYCEG